jgi:PAT family beta-lactamase induction signal transducer AmpG
MADSPEGRLGVWRSLKAVSRSWRLLSVSLLSFTSGLPLGLVWLAVPTWMAEEHVDIKVIGLFTLAQAPWSFKLLWSPLMDRYPVPLLGRKRGWMLVSQVALLVLGFAMAAASTHPLNVSLIGLLSIAIAVASATHDIAYDAYAVEVLHKEEHGIAVGARLAFYRLAMWIAGRLSITASGWTSWRVVNGVLALFYVPSAAITAAAPEPEVLPPSPKSLREAVWEPFVGFLAQHRALEILAFVVLYKLAENLTQALTGPFLVQMGYTRFDVGVAAGTVGLFAIVIGTFIGGLMTEAIGLGPALWISGLLQLVANLGYAVVAEIPVNRPVMYTSQALEYITTGMGNGAFGVLLLRLTQKRFSATQYALLSSLFTLPRILSGPPAGILAATIGWRNFFLLTPLAGIPGMLMLARFVPWGVKDPQFHVPAAAAGRSMRRGAIVLWACFSGLVCGAAGLAIQATFAAIRARKPGGAFDWMGHLAQALRPQSLGDWVGLAAVLVVAVIAALGTAATLVARSGLHKNVESE